MVPNLTARPLFSPIYLNRTCANSANSAILIIKMLEMIGIMQKLHLYHRLVEKYEYLFYFIIYLFFYFSRALPHLPHMTARPCMDLLEKKGGDCLVDQVPVDGAILFDGMAVMQAMRSRPDTFGELAETILQNILQLALQHKCTRIDFVTDQYPLISIKNIERSCRADAGSQRMQIFGPDQRTPTQWKKFLSEGTNTEFLYVVWKNADLTIVGKNLCLHIQINVTV